jgi:hypothetical protein
VHFHTPSDCFKGMHVDIVVNETETEAPKPLGCL